MSDTLTLRIAGEQGIIAYLHGDSPDLVSGDVQALVEALPIAFEGDLIDLVPSYDSVLVVFDGLRCDHYRAAQLIREARKRLHQIIPRNSRLVEIPVYYSPESGEDLEALSVRASLTIDEVITLHSADEYRVYAIGFAPGFAYLGYVDERLATPRLSTPRQRVPRGAVAIADRQTAVYPDTSPGGWNLIGRSPTLMFNPSAETPMPVAVGDRVRFVPIDRTQYIAAGGEL